MYSTADSYYLVIDTETTGIPIKRHAPIPDLGNWPRLVELAWLLMDSELQIMTEESHIIRPEGFSIPEEAANVHGITQAKALAEGSDLDEVLNLFMQVIDNYRPVIVTHNAEFDRKVIAAEFLRRGTNYLANFMNNPYVCTMKASVELCAIEDYYRPGNFKWPRLQEVYTKLFGEDYANAHDGLADAKACSRVFAELRRRRLA